MVARSRLSLVMVVLLAFGAAGCNKLKARDRLNKGVQAYKAGRFDDAIEKFKEAKMLDPDLLNARLYLATAYATQYIPGAPSEENTRNGQQAVEEFRGVLDKDTRNLSAIDGIGSILYNMGGTPYDPQKFEESKKYHQLHIQIKQDDPEPYYWVGLIDWTLSFRGNNKIRADYNATARKMVKDIEPMPAKEREQFTAEYGPMVDDGIKHLEMAIQRKPDYDAAYAYMNLLYRQKADQAATAEEREAHLTKADQLVEQFKVIKQKKMEQQATTPAQQ